ncbi:MAG: BPTI/Kunitz domain-containing protein [Pseudomonadota bacterium]|nr:BPTI/Kunitz domain-containing protein [Pseudomonadota bacterium]
MRYLILSVVFAMLGLLAACQNHDAESPLPDACYQPPKSGMCKASFQRYYHDPESGTCHSFIWGGCKGSVPFETLEECVTTCNASPDQGSASYSGKGAPR